MVDDGDLSGLVVSLNTKIDNNFIKSLWNNLFGLNIKCIISQLANICFIKALKQVLKGLLYSYYYDEN